ncbi:MAG: hypothetical protein IAF58_07750 [Leptolyngbya sp.]|nr:hypothetical protein [Candidatus Melainabacteria bacterium]
MTKESDNQLGEDIQALTLELTDAFTLDELRKLHQDLIGEKPPGRKPEIAENLSAYFNSPALKGIYDSLSEVERLAIAEALHSDYGYDPERFKATYGDRVNFGQRSSYLSAPMAVRIFLQYLQYNKYGVRKTLRNALLKVVPKPDPPSVASQDKLPESYNFFVSDGRRSSIEEGSATPLETVERSEPAQAELWSVLRMIKMGKLIMSDKTFKFSTETLLNIESTIGGDYYPLAKTGAIKELFFIKAHGWTSLLQAAGLAKASGKKLAFTKTGTASISQEPPKLVKSIWKAWLASDDQDELRRIDVIKGQTGRAKRSLSPPSQRRQKIANTLAECPSGKWISVDNFFKFMQALGNSFMLSHNPSTLYIGTSNYGSLEYWDTRWDVLHNRYVRCCLMECIATLGLIDIAFVHPLFGPKNYANIFGAEQLPFLSRYDGLLYFKINKLGAFCLDKSEIYTDVTSKNTARISVLQNKRITLVDGKLSIADALLLDSFSDLIAENTWELSTVKALVSCEAGLKVQSLRKFLESHDDQELPEQVQSFLRNIEDGAGAVRVTGTANIYTCRDKEIAKKIVSHSHTKKLCQLFGESQLVVRAADDIKFRDAIHVIGYGTASFTDL